MMHTQLYWIFTYYKIVAYPYSPGVELKTLIRRFVPCVCCKTPVGEEFYYVRVHFDCVVRTNLQILKVLRSDQEVSLLPCHQYFSELVRDGSY